MSRLFALSLLVATGCAGSFELVGEWDDQWMGSVTITEQAWGDNEVVSWDGGENFVIVRYPEDAEHNAGTFSKIVYTDEKDGVVWYCEVDFGHETAEAAEASTETADASDLENGCAGYSWTSLTRQEK